MTCSVIPQFSSTDVVAARVKNVSRGDSFVFVLAYTALKELAPPVILKELTLSFSDRDKIPTVIGTDANAHH